jgi:hypothetical protein
MIDRPTLGGTAAPDDATMSEGRPSDGAGRRSMLSITAALGV